MNASDYDSLQNLAVAYRETGRVADAEAILRLILKSGEDYAPAYNEMGMFRYQKGDNLGRLYKMTGETARARASPEYRQLIPR